LIDTIDLFSCRGGCEPSDVEEKAAFSSAPDPAAPYNKLVIRATVKTLADPPEASHRRRIRPAVRTFTAEYRWDAAKGKFLSVARGLAKLDEFNAKYREE